MVSIGSSKLSASDFSTILFEHDEVGLDPAAVQRVAEGFDFLKAFSQEKLIYGINTGFGPMAQYKVSDERALALQYNLIRSHSSGGGKLLDPLLVRATMIARLNSLMQGYSGIHPDLVHLLAELIRRKVYPCIYEHGGVGASGDLIQLAHLGLALIGEGKVWYQGQPRMCAEVFSQLGLQPLQVRVREGLAILNGTSAMTGIGMVNVLMAHRLIEWSVVLSAMTNEIVEAYDDHFSFELNAVKPHPGQSQVASMMRQLLQGSQMIHSRSEHLYNPANIKHDVFEDKVQEYYSLRCVTQILGPVLDTLENAERVLVNELNSVNDNPVVDPSHQNIYHGGNFHGDYVSLEMDKLKIAVTRLSMLSERQLNYLLNDKLNQILPPFVNLGVLGFNFGMQGMQFTATSTVAENQTLSFPMYVHSIPNNNDNQDIVSMGCNGALLAHKVVENSFEVLVIQMMTVVQAIDYLKAVDRLSPHTRRIFGEIRKIFPRFVEDQPKYEALQSLKSHMISKGPSIPWEKASAPSQVSGSRQG